MKIKFPGTQYEAFSYPAGERQVRLKEPIQSAHVIVEATVKSPADLVDLLLLGNAIHGQNVASLNLHIPYLPYGRADRRFTNGDCLGLQFVSELLRSQFDFIRTLDAHSQKSFGIESVRPDRLIALALAYCNAGAVLFPDEGAKQRYQSFVNPSCLVFYATKKRDAVTGKLEGFSVPDSKEFNDANVLIIDDICDGGGTFVGIADALGYPKEKMSLYVTHGIFSKGFDELEKRFNRIFTTNSFHSIGSEEFVSVYDAFQVLEWSKNSCCL